MNKCKFVEAFRGKCGKDSVGDYCSDHFDLCCVVCGGQATHSCAETMGLVCGTPLCDNTECISIHNQKAHSYAVTLRQP